MTAMTKTNYFNIYFINIYNTEKKELIWKLERKGVLQKHRIFYYKVDPTNPEIFYFSLWNYTEAVVAKSNVFKGNTETYSTLTGFTSQPLNFLINDTWNNVFVIHTLT